MIDLSVSFCGFEFKNPVIVASSPITGSAAYINRCIKAGVGGVVTKTATSKANARTHQVPGFFTPRYLYPNEWNTSAWGGEGPSSLSPEEWIKKEIPKAKGLCKKANVPLIASVGLLFELDSFAKVASLYEEAGADMLELNLSCPTLGEIGKGSVPIAADPELSYEVTKRVTEATSIPVMPKMIPFPNGAGGVAIACEKGGAKAISGCNSFLGVPPIDIEREEMLADCNEVSIKFLPKSTQTKIITPFIMNFSKALMCTL